MRFTGRCIENLRWNWHSRKAVQEANDGGEPFLDVKVGQSSSSDQGGMSEILALLGPVFRHVRARLRSPCVRSSDTHLRAPPDAVYARTGGSQSHFASVR